ncbi:MAG: C4-type zinc ribbon domain-containing protein [Myxococcota bacterium]|nr:C4-type zinc ribbon domain-containing protein [Myxococcota bacterium]
MHEDSLKLEALWRKDLARDALLEESRGLKARIADRAEAAVKAEQVLSEATARLAELKTQEKEVHRQAETYEKQRDRAQRSIDQGIGDYEAATAQFQKCSQILDDLETQELELMEALDEATEALERATQTQALVSSQHQGAQRAYDDRYPSLKAEFDAATAERDAAREGIWRDLLQRYDNLRKKRRPAIVPVNGDACGGCNMQVNATDLSDHRRAVEVMFCRHCGRILGEIR